MGHIKTLELSFPGGCACERRKASQHVAALHEAASPEQDVSLPLFTGVLPLHGVVILSQDAVVAAASHQVDALHACYR